MGRKHWHPASCGGCGITREEAHISQTGLCKSCALKLELANIEQLEGGAGPFYDHWLNRLYLSMHRRVVARERAAVYAEGGE